MLSRAPVCGWVLIAGLGLLSACTFNDSLDISPEARQSTTLESANASRPDRPCRTLNRCAAVLNKAVSDNWRLPPGADAPGLLTTLRVKVNAQGIVQTIHVYRSSGNEQFDAAAEEAVRRTQPFHELKGLRPADIKDGLELEFRFNPQMARRNP